MPLHPADLPPVTSPPMSRELWTRVVETLEFSPQQERLVWHLLAGLEYKQAACELGLSEDTLKTYVDRIGRRLGVRGKSRVVARVYSVAIYLLECNSDSGCHPNV